MSWELGPVAEASKYIICHHCQGPELPIFHLKTPRKKEFACKKIRKTQNVFFSKIKPKGIWFDTINNGNVAFFFFFEYKCHDFFLFKKYILQVIVISGTWFWKQHIHTIFSADILYSINFYMYIIEQRYLNHERWSNNKDKLAKPSFLPSVEHICLSYIDFLF